MATDKNQIKELLGQGLDQGVVAAAVGCDPGWIHQCLADETFRQEVMALKMKNLTAQTSRDNSIDGIEDKLIAKLDELVTEGSFYKPKDVLSAFRLVNSAKRRGAPTTPGTVMNTTVIQLQLPREAVKKFTINPTGEVLEVEGQTLVTMPTGQLLRTLAQQGDAEKYQKVGRHIPSAQGGVLNIEVDRTK